jgi:hypothetical protein
MDTLNPPVRYEVTATPTDWKVRDRFLTWMRDEHAADLLAVPGCTECRVYEQADGSIRCEYTFSTRSALNRYLEVDAPTLRGKATNVFQAGEVTFTRTVSELRFLLTRHHER